MEQSGWIFYLFSFLVLLNGLIQFSLFLKNKKPLSFFIALWLFANVFYYFYHGLFWNSLLPDFDFLYGSLILCGCMMLIFIYYTFYFLLNPYETFSSVRLVYFIPLAIITIWIYYFSFPEAVQRGAALEYSRQINFPEYYHDTGLIIFEYLYLGLFFLFLVILIAGKVDWKLIWRDRFKVRFWHSAELVIFLIIFTYMGAWVIIFYSGWFSNQSVLKMGFLYLFVVNEFVLGIIYVQLIPYLVQSKFLKFNLNGPHYLKNPFENIDFAGLKKQVDYLLVEAKVYLDENLDLKSFSAQAGVHSKIVVHYCGRILKTRFDDMINRFRVEEALRLMSTCPEMKIIDIGYSSGFSAVSTFYKQFKKKTGYSPEKYRSLNIQ